MSTWVDEDSLVVVGPVLLCGMNDEDVLVPIAWSGTHVDDHRPFGIVWWHERDDTTGHAGSGRRVIWRGSD